MIISDLVSYIDYPIFGLRGLIAFVFPKLFPLLQEVTWRKQEKERKRRKKSDISPDVDPCAVNYSGRSRRLLSVFTFRKTHRRVLK